MKAINLILILGLLNSAAYALDGGGDGDLGGGPSVTTGALTVNGLDEEVYTDLVEALKDRKFNRDLLDRAGIPEIKEDDVYDRFKGVKFHPNGSLSFTFERNPELEQAPVNVIKVRPSTIDPLILDRLLNLENEALSVTPDWRTNWTTTVTRAEVDEPSAEVKEVDLFKTLSDQYGEEVLVQSFDTVIKSVGAQIYTGQGHYFKLEKTEDLEKLDMQRLIDMSADEFDPSTFGLPEVDAKTLKEMPANLEEYLKKQQVYREATLEGFNPRRGLSLGVDGGASYSNFFADELGRKPKKFNANSYNLNFNANSTFDGSITTGDILEAAGLK